MAILHARGTILLVANVPDQNGVNEKTRPVVLVLDYHDTDQELFGVAVTTTFDEPLPASSVPLPWQQRGNPHTGLHEESVAVCTWRVSAVPTDVVRKLGYVRSAQLVVILDQYTQNLQP